MNSTEVAGSLVIGIAGVLLAGHYRGWQELWESGDRQPAPAHRFRRRLLRRRTYASGLMAVIGIAIALKSSIPIQPIVVSVYLFGLLAAVVALAGLGIADWVAMRNEHDRQSLTSLRAQLAEHLEQQRGKLARQRENEGSPQS